MSDTTSLIERIEAATEGSRELDARIAPEVGWKFEPEYFMIPWTSPDGEISRSSPPKYTTSIDAALSLLPEGWSAKLCIHDDESYVDVYGLGPYINGDRKIVAGPFEARAATAPLALLAAILRARQTEARG